MSFNPEAIRIRTHIDTGMFFADCLLPGCGWTLAFTTMHLSRVIDECKQHPCKSALINELRVVAGMTPNEGMQYLRHLLARHDRAAEMGA